MLLLEDLLAEGLGRRPRPLRPSDEPLDATDVVSASCCQNSNLNFKIIALDND
jgi:hypothetical protein